MSVRPQTLAAILAAAQRITGPIFSENFDGVTAPALPVSLDFDPTLVTSAASLSGMSAPNQLLLSGANGYHIAESGVSDAVGGNCTVSAKLRFATVASFSLAFVFSRATASMLGATASGTAYAAMLVTEDGLRLYKFVAGSATQIGSSIGGVQANVTYKLWQRTDGSIIDVRVRRLSDDKYLNSSGTWVDAPVVCISATDTAISPASGKAGIGFNTNNGFSIYGDDLKLEINRAVFGDSIAAGFGVTNSWVTLLDESRDEFWRNHAVSGYQAADAAALAYSKTPAASMIHIGANDQRTDGYGSDATKRGHWKKIISALMAWCALSTKKSAQAADASTGSWSNSSVYGGALGQNSSTSGSTLTFNNISGSVIYVGYTAQDSQTGTFKVKVDGVDVATGATAGDGITTISGQPYAPELLRISGLSSGSHTVVFETTNSGLCYCDWVAGIGGQSAFNRVSIGNVLSPNATGFASYGVDETNVGAYNTDLAAAVSTLAGDGLPITLVDLHALTMSYQADGFHPDDAGAALIATAMSASL